MTSRKNISKNKIRIRVGRRGLLNAYEVSAYIWLVDVLCKKRHKAIRAKTNKAKPPQQPTDNRPIDPTQATISSLFYIFLQAADLQMGLCELWRADWPGLLRTAWTSVLLCRHRFSRDSGWLLSLTLVPCCYFFYLHKREKYDNTARSKRLGSRERRTKDNAE